MLVAGSLKILLPGLLNIDIFGSPVGNQDHEDVDICVKSTQVCEKLFKSNHYPIVIIYKMHAFYSFARFHLYP
jgi:hypothetical protein